MTLPKLKGLRPRYGSRSDQRSAAILAKSMLRLGICRVTDWTGSAVDFVAKGLARYCRTRGLGAISRVFPESSIRLLDEVIEPAAYQRMEAETAGLGSRMFLLVDYEQAAMVQIGPILNCLGAIHRRLPAAFFVVLTANLRRWMRVYDFQEAEIYADDQKQMLEDDELQESFYPKVAGARPGCLKMLPAYEAAIGLLQAHLPKARDPGVRKMLGLCLQMHEAGQGYELASPQLLRDELPEMEDYLEETDCPGPGALLVFEEDDLIEACYNEETQYIGENYPIGSTVMLLINMEQDAQSRDHGVKAAFDYLDAMLRSLATASKLIEKIRGFYDEDMRQRGIERGLQAQAGALDLRRE